MEAKAVAHPRGRTTKNIQKSGIAYGALKGHIVTPREKKARQSRTKGRLGKRVKMVREVIREVSGYSPYEKRIIEILRGGGNNPGKRAHRFAKNRLGTQSRAKAKVEMLGAVIAEMKRREAADKAKASAVAKAAAAPKV